MGRKGVITRAAAVVFKGGALKQLKHGTTRTGGRNNLGRITSFHRGGGAKRALRQIDLKRSLPDMTGTVERVEYDPVRTGRIALIRWEGDNSATSTAGGEEKEIESSVSHKIKDMQRRALPRGIHDLPRRALRSAVATICGVPLASCGKRREPVTVNIDGKKKFSSIAWDSELDLLKKHQLNFLFKNTEHFHCGKLDTVNEDMMLSSMNVRSWEKNNAEEHEALLKKFEEVLQVESVS